MTNAPTKGQHGCTFYCCPICHTDLRSHTVSCDSLTDDDATQAEYDAWALRMRQAGH